jgi:hypothetical protein
MSNEESVVSAKGLRDATEHLSQDSGVPVEVRTKHLPHTTQKLLLSDLHNALLHPFIKSSLFLIN